MKCGQTKVELNSYRDHIQAQKTNKISLLLVQVLLKTLNWEPIVFLFESPYFFLQNRESDVILRFDVGVTWARMLDEKANGLLAVVSVPS